LKLNSNNSINFNLYSFKLFLASTIKIQLITIFFSWSNIFWMFILFFQAISLIHKSSIIHNIYPCTKSKKIPFIRSHEWIILITWTMVNLLIIIKIKQTYRTLAQFQSTPWLTRIHPSLLCNTTNNTLLFCQNKHNRNQISLKTIQKHHPLPFQICISRELLLTQTKNQFNPVRNKPRSVHFSRLNQISFIFMRNFL